MNPDQSQQQGQPQGFPQAPVPPPMGGAPGMPPQESDDNRPITDEEKKTLMTIIQQIKSGLKNFDASNFAAKQKIDIYRAQTLKEVFDELQGAGVDLTSRESVASFIQRLQTQNPELATIFEKSMASLMGDESAQPQPSTESPQLQDPSGNQMIG